MAIYAISDLHLCLGKDKPMDVFGNVWKGYMDKLQYNWNKTVNEDDYVLIPGDISWATYLCDAVPDFDFIEKMPGRKIILKGNHDYWWSSNSKLNKFLDENSYKSIIFLNNNSFTAENMVVYGTRGWTVRYGTENEEYDKKIYKREVERFKLSLKSAAKTNLPAVAMFHYPPFENDQVNYDYIELMKQCDTKLCLYGHLHSDALKKAVEGEIDGIIYKCISADYLNFMPWPFKKAKKGIRGKIKEGSFNFFDFIKKLPFFKKDM